MRTNEFIKQIDKKIDTLNKKEQLIYLNGVKLGLLEGKSCLKEYVSSARIRMWLSLLVGGFMGVVIILLLI